MLLRLILLFTLIPLAEIVLLLEVGARIGTVATVAVVVCTGVAGAVLARVQGFGLLRRLRDDLNRGIMPTEVLLDGVLVLAGALLLLTPGLMTDAVGLALLVPYSRSRIKLWLRRRLEERVASGEIHFSGWE